MQEINDLGKLIGHTSVLFRRHLDQTISNALGDDTGLISGRNFWILRYLEDHRGEDVFQRDLENVFKIRRSTVSKTVELMEQKHLLERVSVDGDARKKKLQLTTEADAVLSDVKKAVEALEADVKENFSEEDYASIMRLLKRLCAFLDRPENFEEDHT